MHQKKFAKNVESMTEKMVQAWEALGTFVSMNTSALDDISKTQSGPATDGKAKRNNGKTAEERTYNDAYCKKYFLCDEVRESFHLYIEYLFSDCSPDFLCKTFKYYCCKEAAHSSICISNWLKLKEFFQRVMLEDLGISNWNNDNAINLTGNEVDIFQDDFEVPLSF